MSEPLCSQRAPRLPLPASVCLLQGPEHPNPGKPFTARGFPRQCYLPDNAQGRKVKARPTPLGVAPLPPGWQLWAQLSVCSGRRWGGEGPARRPHQICLCSPSYRDRERGTRPGGWLGCGPPLPRDLLWVRRPRCPGSRERRADLTGAPVGGRDGEALGPLYPGSGGRPAEPPLH